MRAPAGCARTLALALATTAFGGCWTQKMEPLALRIEPVPYADTLPITEPDERSENREQRTLLVHAPIQLAEPFDPGEGEALNLTHYDDVVSSAWFERRLGYRPVSAEEMALGPTLREGAPAATGPLEIKSVKTEGVTPGFTAKDTNGNTYIMKFDPPDLMHLTTAAGVISNRIMWALGYHVPEDYLTEFDFDRLVLDEDAVIEEDGSERPLTLDDVRALLTKTDTLPNGRYLAFASRYVPGIPKGPFFLEGTRDDDPNDHYDHEHRRELRGLEVFSALINNNDMREGNTLDVFVQPGYLRHYVIDFGATLGSSSTRSKHRKDETERPVDLYRFVGRLATLGIYSDSWEDEPTELIDPALGFLHEDFDPDSWKPSWTNPAFTNMTHADAYWAAKIVSALTDEHVAAAVSAGGLPRPDLEATLARLIRLRRDRLVEYYFRRVSTVEEPVVSQQSAGTLRLSFKDLGIEWGVWTPEGTVYDWRLTDPASGHAGSGAAQPRAGGDQRIDITWTGGDAGPGGTASDELAVLEVTTRRPGIAPKPAAIFLRRDGRGYRVVGLAHGDPRK